MSTVEERAVPVLLIGSRRTLRTELYRNDGILPDSYGIPSIQRGTERVYLTDDVDADGRVIYRAT